MEGLNDILALEVADEAERERIARLLRDNPEARQAVQAWMRLTARIRQELDADLPDRRLLVLEGLRRAGGEFLLSDGERHALTEAGEALALAVDRHPCLLDVFERTRADVASFEDAWESTMMPSRPLAADRRPVSRRSSSPKRWVWRTSAGLAIMLFAVLLVFVGRRNAGLVTVATGPGEVLQVELADGSHARLLENSRLAYHPPGLKEPAVRFARLSGDAFFDVQPGREGFTVEAPTAVIVVLGTSFGLRAGETSTEVVLASGRLSVASRLARDRPVVLESGRMTRVDKGGLPTAPDVVELSGALAWTGLFVFRATTVEQAISRLQDAYSASIRVDRELLDETITGTFERDQSLDAILDAIASALDAEVQFDGSEYRLTPALRA